MTTTSTGVLLGVLGGCGGAGATSLAAALAACSREPAVVVDLDALGGGIDVVLGAEDQPGARWSGLHASGGHLDPAQLLDGLPRWAGVPVLACDSSAVPDPDAVGSVLRAGAEIGTVLVDLGRCSTPARTVALQMVGGIVLLVPAEMRGATAAAAMRTRLSEDGFEGPVRVVVRCQRPVVSPARIAEVLGLELAGTFDDDAGIRAGRDRGIDARRLSRNTRSLAVGLLARTSQSGPVRGSVAA